MTFAEMLYSRESCRHYADKPVSRELLTEICEAGRLSPSGCNAQPWKFLAVDEPQALDAVRDGLVVENGETGAPWRGQVPAFILLCEQHANVMPLVTAHYGDTQRFAQSDIGMACMSMCYRALELGLATCVIGVNNQQKLEEGLGIPQGTEVRLVLAVGYPAREKPPRPKARKPFDEVVCWNHWN